MLFQSLRAQRPLLLSLMPCQLGSLLLTDLLDLIHLALSIGFYDHYESKPCHRLSYPHEHLHDQLL